MTWKQKKQQSIDILNKYKDEISKEEYDRILSVIGNQALADLFVTEKEIKDLIRVVNGELTHKELIEEYKKEWGITFLDKILIALKIYIFKFKIKFLIRKT